MGQKFVNQGSEISDIPILNTGVGEEVSINLADYIYNDDQCIYTSQDTNFIVDESVIRFMSSAVGQFAATIDINDGEDENLTKEIEIQVNVVEQEDAVPPEFNSITLNGTEDESLVFNVNGDFNELDGENLSYNIPGLPVGWSQTWNGEQVTIIAPQDYEGTISNLRVEASDPQNNKIAGNYFNITKTVVQRCTSSKFYNRKSKYK